MRKARRFAVDLESLEGKALLSTVPFLSQNTFNQVVHRIDLAAGTFAKTHNASGFDAALAQISRAIPNGGTQLYPTWHADESIYSPAVKGSGLTMIQHLKADLRSYVQTSVANGTMSVSGNWAGVKNPASTSTTTTTVSVPVLTQNRFKDVLKQIDRAAGTYAKNRNAAAFDAALASISFSIPYGHNDLYPTWQSDEMIYSPSVAGSGVQMVSQIKTDLVDYVHSMVASGNMQFR
jgi:hypothetical protein